MKVNKPSSIKCFVFAVGMIVQMGVFLYHSQQREFILMGVSAVVGCTFFALWAHATDQYWKEKSQQGNHNEGQRCN